MWAFLLLWSLPAFARAADVPTIEYRLEPRFEGGRRVLMVDLRFAGDASGTTRLRLPSRWAGQVELFKEIQRLEVVTPGAALRPGDGPEERTIAHGPSTRLHVRYRVAQDWDGPLTGGTCYRAVLGSDYLQLIGHAFVVAPVLDENAPVRVSLDWRLPGGWTVADSFGAGEASQTFTRTLAELRHAVYVAGDFRLRRLEVEGRPVWLAIRGAWRFKDKDFAGLAEKTLRAERGFWRDRDFPYFLITLMPLDGPCCAADGTGLTDSFAAYLSSPTEIGPRLAHLLSHELFHTWNGEKIRMAEPEELNYWFSEGFTDYYAYRLSLRAGLIDLKEYVAQYDRIAQAYYASPARNEPNERIRKDFWNDQNVELLPYQRGFLLAHNWDARVKARSGGRHSLDDAMRDILRRATLGVTLSTGSFIAAMAPYADVADDVRRFVGKGETIVPDAGVLGPCATLEMADVPEFELGFDWKATEPGKVVRGVVPASAAYEAGVRDGQPLAGFSIYGGDVSKQVRLDIQEGGRLRSIRYWPTKRARERTPQFRLDEERATTDSACLSWFR